jgi:hypothetical protein
MDNCCSVIAISFLSPGFEPMLLNRSAFLDRSGPLVLWLEPRGKVREASPEGTGERRKASILSNDARRGVPLTETARSKDWKTRAADPGVPVFCLRFSDSRNLSGFRLSLSVFRFFHSMKVFVLLFSASSVGWIEAAEVSW